MLTALHDEFGVKVVGVSAVNKKVGQTDML